MGRWPEEEEGEERWVEVAGGLPPQAATTRLPKAVPAAVSKKRRRENEAMEWGWGKGNGSKDFRS